MPKFTHITERIQNLDTEKPALITHIVDNEEVCTTFQPSPISEMYISQGYLFIDQGGENISIEIDTITDIDQDI